MQQYRMLIHRQAEGGPRFWQEERELITRSNTTINAQWPGPLLLTSPTLRDRQSYCGWWRILQSPPWTPWRPHSPCDRRTSPSFIPQQAPESYPETTYEVEPSSLG